MIPQYLSWKKWWLVVLGCLLGLSFSAYAEGQSALVAQQLTLLNQRLVQAQLQAADIQKKQAEEDANLSATTVSPQLLLKTELDIAIVKSNLDSVRMELSEVQLTVSQLQKDVQDLENRLNTFSIFGLKITRGNVSDATQLEAELEKNQKLLEQEQQRLDGLLKLQQTFTQILDSYTTRYQTIDTLVKSRTVLLQHDVQVNAEAKFLQEQHYWLNQFSALNTQLNQMSTNQAATTPAYTNLERLVFEANERANYSYVQALLAHIQGKAQLLKLSIVTDKSIVALNNTSTQLQRLYEQLNQVNELLQNREHILNNYKTLLTRVEAGSENYQLSTALIASLTNSYKEEAVKIVAITQQLKTFEVSLDKSIHHELSARQGLPGFSLVAWRDLGGDMLLVPPMTLQAFKKLGITLFSSLSELGYLWWSILFLIELAWVTAFVFLSRVLKKVITRATAVEQGNVSFKCISLELLRRNLIDIGLLGVVLWLFPIAEVPLQNIKILLELAGIWLLFKVVIGLMRITFLEVPHDRTGRDVKLYHSLKWTFIIGGILTAFMVLIHQLPVSYGMKDFSDRIFLLFLFVFSLILLRAWDVVPSLIVPYLDKRRYYLKHLVRIICLLVPLLLLFNSIVGLCGYLNFVLTISWYQGVFVLVLAGYLVIRGVIIEIIALLSEFLVRYVTNGWLWMEAFLKPLDKICRVILFLMAGAVLFLAYGWDKQSSMVNRLTNLLHYQMFDVLGTVVTPLNIAKLFIVLALLYWAGRWTREFVYRFLSRTRDISVRNSVAILSQYTVVVTGVLIGLRVLGIDVRSLTFIVSALAFGVGLGLRDLVNNFACGFLLLFERPIRVGDVVSFNNIEGDVMHIGSRSITVRTWDHTDLVVPNTEVFNKTFINWSGKDHIVRCVFHLNVAHDDNPYFVQELIYGVLKSTKNVLAEPVPEVFMKEMSEAHIEFEVRYYVNLLVVYSRAELRSEILLHIADTFTKNKIKPPYPHHEVYVKSLPLEVSHLGRGEK